MLKLSLIYGAVLIMLLSLCPFAAQATGASGTAGGDNISQEFVAIIHQLPDQVAKEPQIANMIDMKKFQDTINDKDYKVELSPTPLTENNSPKVAKTDAAAKLTLLDPNC